MEFMNNEDLVYIRKKKLIKISKKKKKTTFQLINEWKRQ